MTFQKHTLVATLSLFLLSAGVLAAQDQPAQTPMIGEIRSYAIDPANRQTVERLHRAGWIQAAGQMASREAYPELFDAIGLLWTSSTDGRSNTFRLPDLRQPEDVDTAARVRSGLDSGDLITGGRRLRGSRSAPAAWIYVGRDASPLPQPTSDRHHAAPPADRFDD